MNKVIMALCALFLVGCGQGNDRLAEKAKIEGRAQLDSQYEFQVEKAKEMEEDLAKRHRFYQAVQGIYEGKLTTDIGDVRIKINLVPSLPPYAARRVRQLDEISYDLNNLYLNAQIVQWDTSNALSAVGCRVEQIRPDMEQGEINIASQSCANVYMFRIGMGTTQLGTLADALQGPKGPEIAAQIRDGSLSKVSVLEGEVHPTTNATVYRLTAARK